MDKAIRAFSLFALLFALVSGAAAQEATETPEATAEATQAADTTPEATAEATQAADTTPEATAEATQADGVFYGMDIAVRGHVDLPVNPRAFILQDASGVAGNKDVLVVDTTEDGLDFAQYTESDEDITLLVKGHPVDFDSAGETLRGQLAGEFDEEAFGDYELWPVIAADELIRLDEILNPDPLVEDSAAYQEQTLAVEGQLSASLDPNTFIVIEPDLVDDDHLIVVNGSGAPLNFVPMPGSTMLFYGMVRDVAYLRSSFADEYDTEFDPALVSVYDDANPALIASAAVNLDDVATIEAILENTALFANRPVVVEGTVDTQLGANGFLLGGGDLLRDLTLPVVPVHEDAMLNYADFIDTNFTVWGVVRAFNLSEIEQEFGIDLDDEAYATYEGKPALLAVQAMPADGVPPE